MELSPRLMAIADFVPNGVKVADIGTDHGYLLIYLIKKGKATSGIGGELNQGPYLSALSSVRTAGLSEKIEIRKGNGLEILKAGEVDVITIAGMGGSTIIEILEAGTEILDKSDLLILQPMIGSEQLRKWLLQQGWPIKDETLVEDDGRIYEIIVAEKNDVNYIINPLLIKNNNPLLERHLIRLIKSDEKIITQLSKSQSAEAQDKLKYYLRRIQDLKVILCQLNSKQ